MLKPIAVVALAAVLATGCETPPTNQQSGAVIGGIAGGILGSQIGHGSGTTAAIIVGTLVGAMAGGALGAEMDANDRLRAQQALESSRTYQATTWRNPDSGATYTVTPTRTYETGTGPCREYETQAYIGGRKENVYGTACRQPDGSWKVVN